MSLALLFRYLMLSMFRMLIHPSSGACDLFVELFHGLYCSGSMCVGVTLWFGCGGGGILMQTTTQHQHTLNQSNTTHEITQQICRNQYTMPVCICIMHHKCTIDQQFIILFYITLPLHVSTLLRHIHGARSQYLLSYICM